MSRLEATRKLGSPVEPTNSSTISGTDATTFRKPYEANRFGLSMAIPNEQRLCSSMNNYGPLLVEIFCNCDSYYTLDGSNIPLQAISLVL